MVITYSFNYDPNEDLLVGVNVSSYSRNQVGLQITNTRLGINWNGDSIAGWGKARFDNFNGYPLTNIGWDLYIIAANIAGGGGVDNKSGLELTFDNGDVMQIYRKAANGSFYMTYSGSQTQAEIKVGDGLGGFNVSSLKISCSINGNDRRYTFYDSQEADSDYNTGIVWDLFGADPFYTVNSGKSFWISDLKAHFQTDNVGAGTSGVYWTEIYLETTGALFTGAVVGLDSSIPINSYALRTALNAGGNAVIIAPNPFFEVSAATLEAQLKKLLTYTNVFGVKQWAGETATLDIGLNHAVYEAGEILRKTMGVEVLDTPVIFSTFIRQWNGLVIADKDAGYVSRGVTTSHLVAFEKSDTKVYEGRATRDAFTIVEVGDFSTPLVPNQISNDKDEEMYYFDRWTTDDTDKAHIVLNIPVDLLPFVVKYPTDLYEKFNNLIKLNKLEIKAIISAVRTTEDKWTSVEAGDSDKYWWYLYNYQSAAWEVIIKYGEIDMAGDSTTSTVQAGSLFYDPQYITVDVIAELKAEEDDWTTPTGYISGDRVINEDTLYTCILNHTSGDTDDEPGVGATTATYWQRTVYDFINYESTAGSAAIFSKLNCIVAIRTPVATNIDINGFWMWDYSVRATFDEDNEPEYSSATINAVAADGMSITLDATSGINLPEKDGFGVGDLIHIVKNVEDYLQDTWDASPINSDVGALVIDITNSASIGVLEDHTYKSFFSLLQHISQLSNSTFWANYSTTNTVLISSADNHPVSGLTLTKADLYNYNQSNWSISYDAKTQKNKIRILGDNVNFIKTLSPALDPFDLGDETEIIDDSDIQTLLQASDMADSLTPRREGNEVIVRLTLDYSNPNQNYSNIKVGSTVVLKLPTASDTSIFNDTLLIMAIDLNRNKQTGDNEHATLSLQKRYS